MGESTGFYPRVKVDAAGTGVVSHAGAVLLVETIRALGLDRALSAALAPWRRPLARHDPGRCCWTWRWRPRSVGTAWPTSQC